ncbi:MAG: methyltransferase FkbM [Hyphomicrobiales bacterium]|nr:methyltransferase FkbM [Hyphomicrobiales bacterium]
MTTKPDPALERSRAIYRGDPVRAAALDAFYADFVQPDALVFDVGAHVGDRTASFRRLGARVVAVEPQPNCIALLRGEFGADSSVHIVEAAIGAEAGRARLQCNTENPTVSTLSRAFIDAARDADGWREQHWTNEIDVAVLTLDDLVAAHGLPDFIKLDIEGYEHAALSGLSHQVAALSFEFTTIQRDVSSACIARLDELGFDAFRASLGESLTFAQAERVDMRRMLDWIESVPAVANSGDIYAWRPSST